MVIISLPEEKYFPTAPQQLPCGQSYKVSTIVNYDSSVVILGIFKSGTTLES